MKLLICIAFHYNYDRLKYLNEVVSTIKEYPHDTKIIIDTNRSFEIPDVDVVVHDELWHPFQLTWEHRKHMLTNLDNYDYFLYLEDDMKLPYEGFIEFVKNFDLLWPNHVPSFIRIEKKEDEEFVADQWHPQNIDNSHRVFFDEKEFILLKQPYHAIWILPQKQLKENIKENFYQLSNNREQAASYVWWDLGKIPLVLVENKMVSRKSFVYHISNTYVNDNNMPNSRIKVKDILLYSK